MSRNINGKATGLPVAFPGKEVLAVDSGTEESPDEQALVSVYASVAGSGVPSGVRLNLFARLQNIDQHVASVIAPVGTSGLFVTATGFLADTWAVYAQATSPDVMVAIAMSAKTCCASPAVRVRPDLLPFFNPGESFAYLAPLIGGPPAPITPFGFGAEGFGQEVTFAGAAGGTSLGPGARILHWQVTPTIAGGTLTFVRQNGTDSTLLTFPAANPQNPNHGFPLGSLVADGFAFTNVAFGLIDYAL